MTGYNRRFSPPAMRIRKHLKDRGTPIVANYVMNAGFLPPEHWVHGPEGGGRNLGEACHIYDLFISLCGAKLSDVTARSIRPTGKQWRRDDNFAATLSFADGSVCTLTYTSLGCSEYPKETMDVLSDGLVFRMTDYKRMETYGAPAKAWTSSTPDKGHLDELAALGRCLREGGPWPIGLDEQIASARAALDIQDMILSTQHNEETS